jgi:hypothetical protein
VPTIEVDPELLREFELGLQPSRPERSAIPARILGYGEISTVFEIAREGLEGIACKRLPIFRDRREIEEYERIYVEYNRLLEEEIGLKLPPHGYAETTGRSGRPVFFILQERVPSHSIGNNAMAFLDEGGVSELVLLVLRELRKVWDYNLGQKEFEVAIDGQISNWSVAGFDPRNPRLQDGQVLYYLDTSTPLFRVAGKEQLDPELFLRSAPSFLVWIIRLAFLEDVMTRYYRPRLVATDLVANFYKEGRADLVPRLVETVNHFFLREAPHLGVEPLGVKEVSSYYREDALIWSLYLYMRRLDRFLRGVVLRREYPYILPGRIRRRR